VARRLNGFSRSGAEGGQHALLAFTVGLQEEHQQSEQDDDADAEEKEKEKREHQPNCAD